MKNTSSLSASTSYDTETHRYENISQKKSEEKSSSIGYFSRLVNWITGLLTYKVCDTSREKSFISILKSFIKNLNPFQGKEVKHLPSNNGQRADKEQVLSAIRNHPKFALSKQTPDNNSSTSNHGDQKNTAEHISIKTMELPENSRSPEEFYTHKNNSPLAELNNSSEIITIDAANSFIAATEELTAQNTEENSPEDYIKQQKNSSTEEQSEQHESSDAQHASIDLADVDAIEQTGNSQQTAYNPAPSSLTKTFVSLKSIEENYLANLPKIFVEKEDFSFTASTSILAHQKTALIYIPSENKKLDDAQNILSNHYQTPNIGATIDTKKQNNSTDLMLDTSIEAENQLFESQIASSNAEEKPLLEPVKNDATATQNPANIVNIANDLKIEEMQLDVDSVQMQLADSLHFNAAENNYIGDITYQLNPNNPLSKEISTQSRDDLVQAVDYIFKKGWPFFVSRGKNSTVSLVADYINFENADSHRPEDYWKKFFRETSIQNNVFDIINISKQPSAADLGKLKLTDVFTPNANKNNFDNDNLEVKNSEKPHHSMDLTSNSIIASNNQFFYNTAIKAQFSGAEDISPKNFIEEPALQLHDRQSLQAIINSPKILRRDKKKKIIKEKKKNATLQTTGNNHIATALKPKNILSPSKNETARLESKKNPPKKIVKITSQQVASTPLPRLESISEE